MSRRSRLVGRPVGRSRTIPCCPGGGGGLWSMTHSAATVAPTRAVMSRTTSSTRSLPSMRIVTVSPTRTGVEGLVTARFTATCPERQAAVARLRVLNTRTDQSHRSTRTPSTGRLCHDPGRGGRQDLLPRRAILLSRRPETAHPTGCW
jgi:hypothetical protein